MGRYKNLLEGAIPGEIYPHWLKSYFFPPDLEGEGQLCKFPLWEGEVWVALGGAFPSCLAALRHNPWDTGFGNGFGKETHLDLVTETSPAFCRQ